MMLTDPNWRSMTIARETREQEVTEALAGFVRVYNRKVMVDLGYWYDRKSDHWLQKDHLDVIKDGHGVGQIYNTDVAKHAAVDALRVGVGRVSRSGELMWTGMMVDRSDDIQAKLRALEAIMILKEDELENVGA